MKPVHQYVREITISYKAPIGESRVVTSSGDAFDCIIEGFNKDTISCQEQLVVLYLNQSNRPIGLYKASQGGITGTVVDIRLILSIALKTTAVALIIAHNHPSGNLRPSKADEDLTSKIKEASKLMDIKLLDHLIVSPTRFYYSFADEGAI